MNKTFEFFKSLEGKDASNSVCPLTRWMNPILLSVQPGTLTFSYIIRNEWLNPVGVLHGGITAAIIDDTIGATLHSLGEPYFCSTINNSIDYFGSAKEGETIIAKTLIIKNGKQLVNAQCEIWNESQTRMLAKGYSNLIKTEKFKHT
jgi:acyl-coenzyme A thioesterase 13